MFIAVAYYTIVPEIPNLIGGYYFKGIIHTVIIVVHVHYVLGR